jgi:uncharacterized protein (DUF4415 family)
MPASKENITRVTRDELRHLKGETDYDRLDAMTDDDIARAVAADPDATPLDIDWDKATIVIPPGKDIITLRLDRDILEWLRAQGKGYQTLINQVLRAFYDAQIKRAKRQPSAQDPREASWKEVYAAAKKPARTKAALKKARTKAARPAKPAKKRA